MNPFIKRFISNQILLERPRWVHTKAELEMGDIAFLLSCQELFNKEDLSKHRHNLVVHESDLPKGKGWSPWVWQILEGKDKIPLSLFEAVEDLDAGPIYLQGALQLDGTELLSDIRSKLADETFKLCQQFVQHYPDILDKKKVQSGESTYYARRGPQDSELDVDIPLKEQFDLLRVVDNERYPAFFDHRGCRYRIEIHCVEAI